MDPDFVRILLFRVMDEWSVEVYLIVIYESYIGLIHEVDLQTTTDMIFEAIYSWFIESKT